ncbi:hypothetical protein D3C87_2066240 [compost metagenome]
MRAFEFSPHISQLHASLLYGQVGHVGRHEEYVFENSGRNAVAFAGVDHAVQQLVPE